MTTPTDPTGNIPVNLPPSTPTTPTSNVDPTGAWSKFLSTPGEAATADQVKQFLQGMMKMFNVIIQQQDAAAKRSAQRLKDAITGEDTE